jgi:hypothetical protein
MPRSQHHHQPCQHQPSHPERILLSELIKACHPERGLAIREANRQTKSKDPVPHGSTTSDARSSLYITRLLAVVLSLLSTASFSQTARSFPGPKSELTSPNGRYVIQNVDHNEDYQHFLFLKDKTSGKSRQVYGYGRDASVVWSPDSRHFALNDGAGSDYTETKIFVRR